MAHKTMMFFVVLTMLINMCCIVFANESVLVSDAEVLVEGLEKLTVIERKINAQADIYFNNTELINDSLWLSYHIYDADHQLVSFEGERIHLDAFDQNAVKGVPISIDLDSINELKELKDQEKMYIQLDIVDQDNLFWFSQNEEIHFSSAEIIYDNGISAKTKKVMLEILRQPLLSFVNILLYIFLIYCVIRYKIDLGLHQKEKIKFNN